MTKEQKRLTLTGSNMPDEVYEKLNELAKSKRLTHYIIELVQKEKVMDRFIESLSAFPLNDLENNIKDIQYKVSAIDTKLDNGIVPEIKKESQPRNENQIIEGKINVASKIEGSIEESVEEVDF
ncbi:hypothetical protein BTS2_3374 [Bacillus sp. TS-2]|nr:hypothetical protein BTS2_3374 [Bacillus sp. TS-2]